MPEENNPEEKLRQIIAMMSPRGNDNDAALRLLKSNQAKKLSSEILFFEDLSPEVALQLIDEGYSQTVADHLLFFKNLNRKVALRLIEKGNGLEMRRNFSLFEDLEE